MEEKKREQEIGEDEKQGGEKSREEDGEER